MLKRTALSLIFGFAGFASTVLADSGHGVTEPTSILHYLVEPLHLILPLSILAALGFAIRGVRKLDKRAGWASPDASNQIRNQNA